MSSDKRKNTGKPSILSQWKNRKNKTNSSNAITPRPQDQAALPSSGQQRLWLLQQRYPENSFYQYGHRYKITGKLNPKQLLQSFQFLLDRHEILRTNFVEDEKGLVLKIKKSASLDVQHFDLSPLSQEEAEEKAMDITQEACLKGFDLAKDLLVRINLLKFAEEKYEVILSIHHIIGDRSSLLLLNQEWFAHYKTSLAATDLSLPALKIQYADYAFWKNAQVTKATDLDYWKNQLAGDLPLLALPSDFPRPKKSDFKGATLSKKLSPELSQQIRQLAKAHQTTNYVVILSALKVLLYRYTGQKDILVGSPFSTRDKVELEKLIGFFNETLVLRSTLSEEMSFHALIDQVKQSTMDVLSHKNVAFDELVKVLQPDRHENINPIFQVMFVYNGANTSTYGLDALQIEEESLDLKVSKFDLTLFASEQNDHIELAIEYAQSLFKAETIQRMLQHLQIILESVSQQNQQILAKIPLLSPLEKNELLNTWNDTQEALPSQKAIHHLIEKTAQLYPEQTAVIYQNDQISYAELNQRANAIATKLLEQKAQTNNPVGLYTNRSVELIIGLVGILKAGAAYLPLDPEYPADRIEYMLQDSGAALVLSTSDLKEQLSFTRAKIIDIDAAILASKKEHISLPEVQSEDLAYFIYTSGSTGKPKGVPITHGNLLHSTAARFSFYPSNPSCFLLLSSFSFDSSVAGIFWTLCSGGVLLIPPKRIEQDTFVLGEMIAQHQVSHTLLLPSLYQTILQHCPSQLLTSLRNVMVAGEACPPALLQAHFEKMPETELYNEYGPTEATVWCIAHKIKASDQHFVPIGKAIPNATVYILDQELQVVPVGVAGELFIGGLGLSKGYLNRPELSAEKFISTKIQEKSLRLYRTGDLARYHADGNIEFLGRVDEQVKIRGFRVEPEEIAKVILAYTGVQEALVHVQKNEQEEQKQQLRLVAYLTQQEILDLDALRRFLKEQLPSYMIPAAIVPLPEFPRLPNGKINRKKLPAPDAIALDKRSAFVAPQSANEKILADIWEKVLNIQPIGIQDNFFAIGGDSILSIQIIAQARTAGILIQSNQIFEYQTIESLAHQIKNQAIANPTISIPVPESVPQEAQAYPLSDLQNAFLFNSEFSEQDQGVLHLEFTLTGNINVVEFQKAWQQSVQRHAAMRTHLQSEKGKMVEQIILPKSPLEWTQYILVEQPLSQKEVSLNSIRKSEESRGIDLYQAPTSRMNLIQWSEQEWILRWSCHHIFLDGWSCGIILKDTMAYYAAIQKKESLVLPRLSSFPDYLHWQREQDRTETDNFWSSQFKQFQKPQLFPSKKKHSKESELYQDDFLELTLEESSAISRFCQQTQISSSTFFQGLWALLLGAYFDSKDVVFGLTLSGRFSNYPGIESISGLFMNVLPYRFILAEKEAIGDWLKNLQKKQGLIGQHENTSLDQIRNQIKWPGHLALFDVLFVYGNFLRKGLQVGELSVDKFEGAFSSTYPLTIRINPLDQIKIDFRYQTSALDRKDLDWIKTEFHQLLNNTLQQSATTQLGPMLQNIRPNPKPIPLLTPTFETPNYSNTYIAPRNETEFQLAKIWENLFNRPQIGIADNFFNIGGRSLLAIQLFAQIEKIFGEVIAPAELLKHPTIKQLAALISKENSAITSYKSLVPMRANGSKAPLFCLHGGGAHVFFYQALTQHLGAEQPVYSLQPVGLDGQDDFHQSIEEMASHYLKEIRLVQPEGPYRILGTCFSNAVALEMAKQLQEMGEHVSLLAIIDSGPLHLFGNDASGKSKTFSRFFDLIKRGDFKRIQQKISSKWKQNRKETNVSVAEESESERNLRRTIDSLNALYAKYHWQAYPGKIHFIRSQEFHERKDKDFHLTQWEKLSNRLEVHVVPGHHVSLFEEPEVGALAKKLAECLEA